MGKVSPSTHQLEGKFQSGTFCTSVLVVERAPKIGCRQGALLPLVLQVQPRGLTQSPFRLLPLPWIPGHGKLCVCSLGVESLFPQPSGFPKSRPHWASNPNFLGAYLFGAEPMRSSDPLLFAENLCSCNYPHLGLNHPGLRVLTIPYLCPTYLSPYDSFFGFRTFLLVV